MSMQLWTFLEVVVMRQVRRALVSKRPRPTRLLFLLVVCAGALALGFRQFGSTSTHSQGSLVLNEGHGEAAARTRSFGGVAAQHRQLLTRPPSQQHAFLIFDTDEKRARSILQKLEPSLAPYRQYPEVVTISQITGAAAISVAAHFSLHAADLPAVVYLPPMWQNGPSLQQASSYSLGQDAAGVAGFSNWAKSKSRMTLLLINDWVDNEMCFYFVTNDDQKEVELGCTKARVELWQEVSLLDRFTARNKTGRTLLAQHVALFSGSFAVHPPGFCNYLSNPACEMPKHPIPTDPAILKQRELNDQTRKKSLIDQPKRIKHFTTVGFEKRRAPDELIQTLSGYLNASWENLALEPRAPDSVFSRSCSPSLKATLPEIGPMKPRLFAIVQRLLEEWIGSKPLQSTAMYGVRVYTRNSTLAMHIDRPDTHIVSAIINVDQQVEEPWPLQILDHAGKLHSVTMQPGDMVMYEGAALGHGRVNPLIGRFFANVFVHYKPK